MFRIIIFAKFIHHKGYRSVYYLSSGTLYKHFFKNIFTSQVKLHCIVYF